MMACGSYGNLMERRGMHDVRGEEIEAEMANGDSAVRCVVGCSYKRHMVYGTRSGRAFFKAAAKSAGGLHSAGVHANDQSRTIVIRSGRRKGRRLKDVPKLSPLPDRSVFQGQLASGYVMATTNAVSHVLQEQGHRTHVP